MIIPNQKKKFTIVVNGNQHSLKVPNIPKKPFHILALLDSSTAVTVMRVHVEYPKKKKILQKMLTMLQGVLATLSCLLH